MQHFPSLPLLDTLSRVAVKYMTYNLRCQRPTFEDPVFVKRFDLAMLHILLRIVGKSSLQKSHNNNESIPGARAHEKFSDLPRAHHSLDFQLDLRRDALVVWCSTKCSVTRVAITRQITKPRSTGNGGFHLHQSTKKLKGIPVKCRIGEVC